MPHATDPDTETAIENCCYGDEDDRLNKGGVGGGMLSRFDLDGAWFMDSERDECIPDEDTLASL